MSDLLSADEFAHISDWQAENAAYAAALAALHEAEASDEESTRLLFQVADERDALATELSELREWVDKWAAYLNTPWNQRGDATEIVNSIIRLAAQPQGIRAALAAIDGAQPERCHAGGDGDCDWPECPQKTTYQQWCPLARRDGSAS